MRYCNSNLLVDGMYSVYVDLDTLSPFMFFTIQKVQETCCKQCYHSPLKGLSTTVTASMQTIPLHPSETHSQPTTNITAAAVAGTTTTY